MAKLRMVKELKEEFPYYIILMKSGSFYKGYGKDSIVMNYVFGYKVNYDPVTDIPEVKEIQTSGFPLNSLSKVLAKLEERKINFMVIDKSENYREIEKKNFKEKNDYQEVFLKATEIYNRKYLFEKEIQEIVEKNISDERMSGNLNYISNYLKKYYGENANDEKTCWKQARSFSFAR